MKRFLLFCLLPTFLIAACDDSAGPGDASAGTVTATIDNASYTSTQANATFANGVLSITSSRTEYNRDLLPVIDMNITNVNGARDYELGGLSGNSGHARIEDDSLDYYTPLLSVNDVAGGVTITRLNANSVAGTFHFVAYVNAGDPSDRKVRVENGSFDVGITR
jgi:hypothetical protein